MYHPSYTKGDGLSVKKLRSGRYALVKTWYNRGLFCGEYVDKIQILEKFRTKKRAKMALDDRRFEE